MQDKSYKESTILLQLVKDNVDAWQEEEEEERVASGAHAGSEDDEG